MLSHSYPIDVGVSKRTKACVQSCLSDM